MAEKTKQAEPKTERATPWPMTSARVNIKISLELSNLLERRYDGAKRLAIARVEETVQLRNLDADLRGGLKREIQKLDIEAAQEATKDIPDDVLRKALELREKSGG